MESAPRCLVSFLSLESFLGLQVDCSGCGIWGCVGMGAHHRVRDPPPAGDRGHKGQTPGRQAWLHPLLLCDLAQLPPPLCALVETKVVMNLTGCHRMKTSQCVKRLLASPCRNKRCPRRCCGVCRLLGWGLLSRGKSVDAGPGPGGGCRALSLLSLNSHWSGWGFKPVLLQTPHGFLSPPDSRVDVPCRQQCVLSPPSGCHRTPAV